MIALIHRNLKEYRKELDAQVLQTAIERRNAKEELESQKQGLFNQMTAWQKGQEAHNYLLHSDIMELKENEQTEKIKTQLKQINRAS